MASYPRISRTSVVLTDGVSIIPALGEALCRLARVRAPIRLHSFGTKLSTAPISENNNRRSARGKSCGRSRQGHPARSR
ncbi:MAG: hypothetical protein ACFFC7_25650 [Candidatus Hermodarchaeota archaeon]